MKNFIVLLCCWFSMFAVAGNTSFPVKKNDFVNTVFSGKTLKVLDETWKFCKGDKKEYPSPDYDDTAWQDIKINTPLAKNNQIKFFLVNYI